MLVRPPVNLQFAHRSDRGSARRINEDTSAAEEVRLSDGRCMVLAAVADGLGGARSGAEASQIAVTTSFGYLLDQLRGQIPRTETQWQQLLVAALHAANAAVHARGMHTGRMTMGTTLMLTV